MHDTSEPGARHETLNAGNPLQQRPARAPRILCVDDDIQLLCGLHRVLGLDYDVVSESDPMAALRLLETQNDFEVVLCDMKMPRLDGTQFLIRSRQMAPTATRLLLTGVPNVDSIASAVNDGGIFQLLMKPCPSDKLLGAVRAAVELHRQGLAPKPPPASVRRPGSIHWIKPLGLPRPGAESPAPDILPSARPSRERAVAPAEPSLSAISSSKTRAIPPGSLLAVLAGVANDALSRGRADEAERLLAAPLEALLRHARTQQRTNRDDIEIAAVLASRLAIETGNGAWIDYVFRLFTALQRLLPSHAIDELCVALHRTRGASASTLELYISMLEFQSRTFGPSERCLLRRIQQCRGLIASLGS